QPQHAETGLARPHQDIQPAGKRPELGVSKTFAKLAPEFVGGLRSRGSGHEHCVLPFAHDRALSRSACRSATASTPTLSRTRLSVTPSAALRSAGTDAWVMIAGWLTRLSTPPSDSASANNFVRSQKRLAASAPPFR